MIEEKRKMITERVEKAIRKDKHLKRSIPSPQRQTNAYIKKQNQGSYQLYE